MEWTSQALTASPWHPGPSPSRHCWLKTKEITAWGPATITLVQRRASPSVSIVSCDCGCEGRGWVWSWNGDVVVKCFVSSWQQINFFNTKNDQVVIEFDIMSGEFLPFPGRTCIQVWCLMSNPLALFVIVHFPMAIYSGNLWSTWCMSRWIKRPQIDMYCSFQPYMYLCEYISFQC